MPKQSFCWKCQFFVFITDNFWWDFWRNNWRSIFDVVEILLMQIFLCQIEPWWLIWCWNQPLVPENHYLMPSHHLGSIKAPWLLYVYRALWSGLQKVIVSGGCKYFCTLAINFCTHADLEQNLIFLLNSLKCALKFVQNSCEVWFRNYNILFAWMWKP